MTKCFDESKTLKIAVKLYVSEILVPSFLYSRHAIHKIMLPLKSTLFGERNKANSFQYKIDGNLLLVEQLNLFNEITRDRDQVLVCEVLEIRGTNH